MNKKNLSLLYFISLMNATVMPLVAMEEDPSHPTRKRSLSSGERDEPLPKRQRFNPNNNYAMEYDTPAMYFPTPQTYNPYVYNSFPGMGMTPGQSYIVAPIAYNPYGQTYPFIPAPNLMHNPHQFNPYTQTNFQNFMPGGGYSTASIQNQPLVKKKEVNISPFESGVTFLMCWPTIQLMQDQVVPEEIKKIIISSLGDSEPYLKIQKIEDSHGRLTNKEFAEMINRSPFVKELKLMHSCDLNYNSIKMALTLYPNLRSLDISREYMPQRSDKKHLKEIGEDFTSHLKKTPNLITLNLKGFPSNLSGECLGNILNSLPKLTSLSISSQRIYGTPLLDALKKGKNLTSLDISNCSCIGNEFLPRIVNALPKLTSLNVEGLGIGASEKTIQSIIEARPNISLKRYTLYKLPTMAEYWPLFSKFLNTNFIDLDSVREITLDHLKKLGKNNPKLTSLKWFKYSKMTEGQFSTIVESFPNLKHFDTNWLGNVTKESLVTGLKKLSHLESLELSGYSTVITNKEDVESILKACSNLQSLQVTDYYNIGSIFYLRIGTILPQLSSLEVLFSPKTTFQELDNILIANPSLTVFKPKEVHERTLNAIREKYPLVTFD